MRVNTDDTSIAFSKRTVRISGLAIGTVYKLNLLRTVFINTAKSLKLQILQILTYLRSTALVRNDGNHKQSKIIKFNVNPER